MVKSVQEIKEAIEQLSEAQRRELLLWQEHHFDDAWDQQVREDSEAGRLDFLIDQAVRDDEAGDTTPL